MQAMNAGLKANGERTQWNTTLDTWCTGFDNSPENADPIGFYWQLWILALDWKICFGVIRNAFCKKVLLSMWSLLAVPD